MTRWKRAERRIAQLTGGHRVPVTGRRGQPDVAHPWLALEVKTRDRLPRWLVAALAQAQAVADRDQLPVAVLHEHGARYRDALVVLRLGDFLDWFVGAGAQDVKGRQEG